MWSTEIGVNPPMVVSVSNCGTFSLLEGAFCGLDKVDVHSDRFADQSFAQKLRNISRHTRRFWRAYLFGFSSIEHLFWISDSITVQFISSTLECGTYLGARVELSCTRCSLPLSFSATLIWSPLQTRTTCPSNTFASPERAELPGPLA